MKVSIVILNWNGKSFLRRFLPSVCKYSNFSWAEVVVVDNGSTDGSNKFVKQKFPGVELIQLGNNYGFAEGYNRALVQIEADYFLLLNSDVEVSEGWLEPMVKMMEKDRAIGACQPKVMSLDQRDVFEHAGASGGFIDKHGYPFCRGRIMNVYEKDIGQYDNEREVFWATGACMLVRASAWNELGGFDSSFWAHMEEIDLCWRMKNRGLKAFVCPMSVVYHLGGGCLSYRSPRKIYLNFRNNLFLLYKNLPQDKLFITLFIRIILDGIAALQFLASGQFVAFIKVLSAHISFYKNMKSLRKKRKSLLAEVTTSEHREILNRSLIWCFFMKKRKLFSELPW